MRQRAQSARPAVVSASGCLGCCLVQFWLWPSCYSKAARRVRSRRLRPLRTLLRRQQSLRRRWRPRRCRKAIRASVSRTCRAKQS
ncbi:hypothetical protein [Lysobacter gummosus]|uniref:hypothetical protein n=1 Tax=Lysobacter gummosus TaxID=262324 RepID=UPI0036367AA1